MLRKLQSLLSIISSLGLLPGISFLINRRLQTIKFFDTAGISYNLTNVKHPIFLRPGTSDSEVFAQIFVQNEYNIPLNFEPKVIIDGGANIGLASIYFKNRFPNATIISIEPDAENAAMLTTNLAKYSDVHIRQASLWSRKTQTRVVDKFNLGKWGLITEELAVADGDDGVDYRNNTLTIDDIMHEFNLQYIDVLKLDIESAEKQLFSDNYMNWLPKTKVIIIELHDFMTEGCSKPFFDAISKTFTNYSFKQMGKIR